MTDNLILYTTHCPKCIAIKNILDNKGVVYTIEDNSDLILEIALQNNINTSPFANINGDILNTKQLQEWIKNKGENN